MSSLSALIIKLQGDGDLDGVKKKIVVCGGTGERYVE